MNTATLPSAVERLDLENTGDRAQVFMHKQRYDFALKGISPSDTALEIGTGTGFFSKVLAEHCESYSGLEISRILRANPGTNRRSRRGTPG